MSEEPCQIFNDPRPIQAIWYDDDDADYYRPDASGYSSADEEWFFDMDGKP